MSYSNLGLNDALRDTAGVAGREGNWLSDYLRDVTQEKGVTSDAIITGGTITNIDLGTASLSGGTISNAVMGTPTITGGYHNNGQFGTGLYLAGTARNLTLGTPAITGGTANAMTIGTPAISGGTANGMTFGTPTVNGLATFSGTTRFGDGTNYAEFTNTGDFQLYGSATSWDDVLVTASSVRLPASGSPTETAYKGSYVLAFSKSAVNSIYFNVQFPHSYKVGSDIEYHAHLAHPDGSAGTSVWQFTYSWASMGVAFPTQSTATVNVTAPGTADIHQYADIIGTISGTAGGSKGISSMMLCSLSRLGTATDDTYDNVVYLLASDFHYEKDALGSRLQTSK